MPSRLLVIVVALVVALLVAVTPAPAALADSGCAACGVDTGPGQYVGSLLIPPGSTPVPPGLPGLAAHCDGCLWTLEPACQTPAATGGSLCPGAMRTCPPPQVRMALLLQRPGESVPRRVGTFCDDAGIALQPSGLLPGVRDRFVALVPALRPDYQPKGLGIVNVPVLYAAGQPGSMGRPTFTLGGHRVVLSATATWRWEFGDGASVTTVRPGGPWPDVDVSHAYASSGRFVVRVITTWEGQFWVDGAGPFVVEGVPVTQSAALSIPVRAARAELWAPRLG